MTMRMTICVNKVRSVAAQFFPARAKTEGRSAIIGMRRYRKGFAAFSSDTKYGGTWIARIGGSG